jgi:hypothetical protein
MLAELRPDSADQLAAALTAQTAAATAGLVPVFTARAAAVQEASKQKQSQADTANGHLITNSSSSSHCRLSFEQLAAQSGVWSGQPALLLPWLQLLARYHALTQGAEQEHAAAAAATAEAHNDTLRGQQQEAAEPPLFTGSKIECQVAAMAAALLSSGVAELPARMTHLREATLDYYAACDAGALLAAPIETPLTPHISSSSSSSVSALAVSQSARQQQQQQGSYHGAYFQGDLAAWAHWLHAGRLMQVQPQQWQQHLAEQLFSPAAAADGAGTVSSQPVEQSQLLADLACDWCGQGLPGQQQQQQQQEEGPSQPVGTSEGGGGSWGCVSCGAAQYCSQPCANAARKVHGDNCW